MGEPINNEELDFRRGLRTRGGSKVVIFKTGNGVIIGMYGSHKNATELDLRDWIPCKWHINGSYLTSCGKCALDLIYEIDI